MANIVLSDLLDESSGVPLYKQVFYYIRSMILDKTLVCDDQLHSVRVMADRFNVSVCTMHRAYELLEKECITNICIVIVRYFGGILLGAGPLSRTYLNSARECIDSCDKKEMYNYLEYTFDCTYNAYNILKNKLEKYIEQEYIIVEDSEFKENVTMKLKIVDFEIENVKKIVEEVSYGS